MFTSWYLQNYVVPWFNSPRVQEQKLEDIRASIEQLQSTVSETMASLNETNSSIQVRLGSIVVLTCERRALFWVKSKVGFIYKSKVGSSILEYGGGL